MKCSKRLNVFICRQMSVKTKVCVCVLITLTSNKDESRHVTTVAVGFYIFI